MKGLAKLVFFKWMGWHFQGVFPDIKKCVVIVIPHTSWHDFYVGVFVRKIIGVSINYVAKASLFKPPFGWYFRWMGGRPIDRSKSHNYVEAIAELFEANDEFRLALAPEGTRKKVEKLRTGFYYIAKTAKVPIVMVAFDYGKKEIKFSEAWHPSEDMEADFAKIKAFFGGVKGKVPAYSYGDD